MFTDSKLYQQAKHTDLKYFDEDSYEKGARKVKYVSLEYQLVYVMIKSLGKYSF